MVVDGSTWRSLDDDQKAVLTAVLLKHVPTVYHSMEEVPDGVLAPGRMTDGQEEQLKRRIADEGLTDQEVAAARTQLQGSNRLMSLGSRGGAKFSWSLDEAGFLWMACLAGEYHSGLGAEYRRDVYVWLFGRWVRVWQLAHSVS